MNALRALHRRLLPADCAVGWTPYLWLVYLNFFFFRYFYVRPGALELALVAVTIAVFLVLYFNGYWKTGWRLVPNIAGLMLLGAAWAPANFGASVFFIYAAAFAAHVGPLRRAAVAIALVVGSGMAVAATLQPSPMYWVPLILVGTLIGVIGIYDSDKQRRNAALRLSQEEVRQLAQVAERERISRDLHDLLGHTLSVITLKAELAARLLEREPRRAEAEIRGVEQVSRAALAQVREAVAGMRTRGLAGELEHARVALKAAAVELATDAALPALAPAAEAALAMVLREAVTNVIRHSQANSCRVSFRAEPEAVVLEVQDDGRGGELVEGGGIAGMRSRLAAAGGRLEISSGRGTRVRAWMPA
ncbi:MAG: sensor histidine kinase [Gammaproteobacteria bacterium]